MGAKAKPIGGHLCPLCLYICKSREALNRHMLEMCACPLPERTCKDCHRVHKTRPGAIECSHNASEGEILFCSTTFAPNFDVQRSSQMKE